MKSETELNHKFEMNDTPYNHFKDMALALFIGFVTAVMILTAVCHADKIDNFFANAYKWLAL